ncbi:MAG: hypothetical protein U0T83_10575 [Bacteriovoracaceae bacterium]
MSCSKGLLAELKKVEVYIVGRSSPDDAEVSKNIKALKKVKAEVIYSIKHK